MTDNEKDDTEDRRHGSRGSALWAARLREGADSHRCKVYDISLTGAKVQIDQALEPGMVIKLDIDQVGVIKGIIAWVNNDRMGITFTSDTEEVRYLLGPRGRRMGLD